MRLPFFLVLLLVLPLHAQESISDRLSARMEITRDPEEANRLLGIALTAHDPHIMLVGLQNPDKKIQELSAQAIRNLPHDLSAPLWMEALTTDGLWTNPAVDRPALVAMLKTGVREDYGVDATGVDLTNLDQRTDLARRALKAFHAAQAKAPVQQTSP